MKFVPQKTLIINTWTSSCSQCGKGANPEEKAHETIVGYGESGDKGCGCKWEYCTSGYAEGEQWCKKMRPDLKWTSPYNQEELRGK